jgi:hypothetical protein
MIHNRLGHVRDMKALFEHSGADMHVLAHEKASGKPSDMIQGFPSVSGKRI